ncbi:MAG TPA: hypothetical protein VGL92_02420 [Acidimicrobiia bacterium]
MGAGLIHASAAPGHRAHAALFAFFVTVAVLQLLWGLAVLRWAGWPLLIAGAALNSVVAATWVLSRTAGLPGVPGAEHVEPVGFKDGVSSLLELALVLSVAGLLPQAAGRLRAASAPMASWVVVAAIGALTTAAVAAPGHHHDETGHRHAGLAGAAHSDDGHAHTAAELAAPGHAGGGHTHEAGDVALAPHDHDGEGQAHHGGQVTAPGHRHDGVGSGHVPDSALLIAAGHDHEPGHVHSPEHHHAGSTGPDNGHEAAHDGEAAHDHGAGTAPEQGSGHDHEAGPGHHDGGHEGGHDHCYEAPGNPVVTTVQETARALGVGCLATHSSLHIPTAEPRFLEAGVD